MQEFPEAIKEVDPGDKNQEHLAIEYEFTLKVSTNAEPQFKAPVALIVGINTVRLISLVALQLAEFTPIALYVVEIDGVTIMDEDPELPFQK